jgi:hypothetical protein
MAIPTVSRARVIAAGGAEAKRAPEPGDAAAVEIAAA